MMLDDLHACPVIGILRGFSWDDLAWVLPRYIEAGFRFAEVTLNTPGAEELIARSVEAFGDDLHLGAGTVLNAEALALARRAGATFVVSPNLDLELAATCREAGLPFFPGALSPTEVERAWRSGATAVKVFPASLGGPDYIRALRGPMADIRLLPTGGVTRESIPDYRAAGAFGLGLGSPLFPPTTIAQRDAAALREELRAIRDAVRGWHLS